MDESAEALGIWKMGQIENAGFHGKLLGKSMTKNSRRMNDNFERYFNAEDAERFICLVMTIPKRLRRVISDHCFYYPYTIS